MRPRLAVLLEMVEGRTVADIGCDHGLLCEAMLAQGRRVIGTELSATSLDKARRRLGAHPDFQARPGDGFDPLVKGEMDCAVMAGMGAATLCGILERAGDKARGPLLLLQPMLDVAGLRAYLCKNGFGLLREELVREGRRYYPILAVRYGQGLVDYPDWMQECGPLLAKRRHPLLQDYLQWRLGVYGQWQKQKADRIREAIAWLAQ